MLERKPLSNNLVKLIPMIKEDYNWIYAVASDPSIWEQHPDNKRYTPIGFTKYFKKLLDTDIPYIILDINTEQVIGATSFYQFNSKDESVAIGFTFLAKAYWGGIYNQSIKKLMMDFAFSELNKIIFHVREGNIRSQKAIEKIGGKIEKRYPSEDGEGIQIEYSIAKK